jgi:hypothetical protein
VTKLDRLARSLPDARDILDELTKRNVKLSLGGSIHDPTDPVDRLLFNVLAMVAEFETDLIRMRTREGMKVAKASIMSATQLSTWEGLIRRTGMEPNHGSTRSATQPHSQGGCGACGFE